MKGTRVETLSTYYCQKFSNKVVYVAFDFSDIIVNIVFKCEQRLPSLKQMKQGKLARTPETVLVRSVAPATLTPICTDCKNSLILLLF